VIHFIKKKDMIRSNIKGSVPSNEEIACASHDPFPKKIRRTLCVWLEYEAQKGLSVVREKAMQLYNHCAL
jgi:hypothetical protein